MITGKRPVEAVARVRQDMLPPALQASDRSRGRQCTPMNTLQLALTCKLAQVSTNRVLGDPQLECQVPRNDLTVGS